MERIILHSDMNCFYASVEMMLHPELRGKKIAVCGSTENRHGIVLAKSYSAKRCGVKTGQANWEARMVCPDLIMVPPHYDEYMKYSKLAQEIYLRYSDLVEPYGMDENWIELTDTVMNGKTGLDVAKEIKRVVKDELGLTVSIGVSYNKIFAKLGSDMKKPDAITVLPKEDMESKIWPLPASDLLYCGRATTNKLARYGIHTIGELAQTDPKFISQILGVNGLALLRYARGEDTSRVMPQGYMAPIKSIGHGVTCVCDLREDEDVWRVMLELAQDVGHRLRVHKMAASGVQICVRDKNLSFRQYQCPLDFVSQSPMNIAQKCRELFREKHPHPFEVRAVQIRAIGLVPSKTPQQLDFFVDPAKLEKREKIDEAVEGIRERFGKRAIYAASLHGDIKIPYNGAIQVSNYYCNTE